MDFTHTAGNALASVSLQVSAVELPTRIWLDHFNFLAVMSNAWPGMSI
jgi:hypothetical protein